MCSLSATADIRRTRFTRTNIRLTVVFLRAHPNPCTTSTCPLPAGVVVWQAFRQKNLLLGKMLNQTLPTATTLPCSSRTRTSALCCFRHLLVLAGVFAAFPRNRREPAARSKSNAELKRAEVGATGSVSGSKPRWQSYVSSQIRLSRGALLQLFLLDGSCEVCTTSTKGSDWT